MSSWFLFYLGVGLGWNAALIAFGEGPISEWNVTAVVFFVFAVAVRLVSEHPGAASRPETDARAEQKNQ